MAKRGRKPADPLKRFEDMYTPEPMSGCWLWKGYRNRKGYGTFAFGRRGRRSDSILANRAAMILLRGGIPAGLLVLHKCNNPACVNPDHLYLGTHSDNMRDMIKAGTHRPHGRNIRL